MKILSFDVGMKNLAYCIVEVPDCSQNYTINDWGVIDLTNSSNKLCSYQLKKKKGQSKICQNKAKYHKNGKYYCNLHSKKCEYKKPTIDFNKKKLKKMAYKKIRILMDKYEIAHDKSDSKQQCLEKIDEEICKNYLEPIEKKNANAIDLVDFGISLKHNLLRVFKNKKIDMVLIENQIGPIALRMKTLQGMLMQHFIERGIYSIKSINSNNKLKHYVKGKTTYIQRKKLSIDITKKILLENKDVKYWLDTFVESKKKDDLADCFLQCKWYIIEHNILCQNIKN